MMDAWHYLHMGRELDPVFAAAMRDLLKPWAPLTYFQWSDFMTAFCCLPE